MAQKKISEQEDPKSKAEKILESDFRNLFRKVEKGKPLTNQERAFLQAKLAGVNTTAAWANTQVELADILQIERKTVQRWLKIDGNPGSTSDGRFNVPAWREWAKQQGRKVQDGEKIDKAKLEAQKLLHQNTLLEIEIARRKGELTENHLIETWVAEMVGSAKTVLLSLPGILAPQVVGLTVPDAERRIRDAIDEALLQLHREPWKQIAAKGGRK